jgi:hypothetical protein
MPLFIYRCPNTGDRVQGFSAEDISEDQRTCEPVTCPSCHQLHLVNPATGKVLDKVLDEASGESPVGEAAGKDGRH